MTKNNKMILGVAAGVAALAVAGVYAKKKGYLNNINTANLKDKFGGLKETAMKAFNGSSADSSQSDNSQFAASGSTGSNAGGTSKRKSSSSTGSIGDINPATA